MADKTERRVHPRLPLKMLVQYRLASMEEFLRDHAVNLSAGGMFLRSQEPLPEGSMVYLQFRLRDGSPLIEGLGRVVHVNPPEHPVPGMGIEFVNLDDDSRRRIDDILRARLGGTPG